MNLIPKIKTNIIILCVTLFIAAAAIIIAPAAVNAASIREFDEAVDSNFKNCVIIQKSYALLTVYWQSLEILNQIKDAAHEPSDDQCAQLQEKYNSLCADMNKTADDISNLIISDLENHKDIRALKMFSAFYKSKTLCERQPLYFVCTPLIKKVGYLFLHEPDKMTAAALEVPNADEFEKQYFPGYGEADPTYYYRLGRELESEVTDTYWKEITTTHTQYETVESEVTREHLNSMYDDPDIDIMEQQGPYEKIVDGIPMMCYKVRFLTLASITTVSKRKYDLNRVWFELLRNKYSILMPSKWEVCGKTYEMHEFYTGCEVILKKNAR
ncbi:MAG TPA: hypothetical protein DC017_12225 [Candidatus Wallbacteria bacterium]|nr:hypothetical protein [Candidatus Wallbacteria bacterium]